MTRPLDHATKPLRILEVGAGTGPFTRRIVKKMGNEDSLVVCEINPRFMEQVKSSVQRLSVYESHADRISFFLGPIQKLAEECLSDQSFAGFDLIVSSLPFTNFPAELVNEILSIYEKLLAPQGSVTFVEYIALRKISVLFKSENEKKRLLEVDRIVTEWCSGHSHHGTVRKEVSKEVTFLNIPPATTIQIQQ